MMGAVLIQTTTPPLNEINLLPFRWFSWVFRHHDTKRITTLFPRKWQSLQQLVLKDDYTVNRKESWASFNTNIETKSPSKTSDVRAKTMKHLENRGYSLMSALETISSMQTNSKISKRKNTMVTSWKKCLWISGLSRTRKITHWMK